jgi:hypothetical protein
MSWLHIHIQLHYRNSTSTRNIQSTDYSYRDFLKSAVGSAYGAFRVNRDMSVHQRITTSFNNTKSKFFISSFFTFLRCTHFLMFLDYKFRYPNIYLYINCFTWNQCQITSLKCYSCSVTVCVCEVNSLCFICTCLYHCLVITTFSST